MPGPQEYDMDVSRMSRGKSWATTVQAFGSTERRFTSSMPQVPGPGAYKSERHKQLAANYVVRRVNGQLMKSKKAQKASASFQSTTGRHIEKEVSHAAKLNYPGFNQYNANEWDTLAQEKIEGGAPNNFLLMKNDRQRAPFNSTVHRFADLSNQAPI